MMGIKKLWIIAVLVSGLSYGQTEGDKVTINIDLSKETGKFNPAWNWFGCDEPNYTYMKDGRKLLTELSAMSRSPVYIRVHNLLTSGNGEASLKWGSTNVYTEGPSGNPVYDWSIVDRIFDALHERGMKPFVEIGFMPEALSSNPTPYRHFWKPGDPYDDVYTGWRYPPKDFRKWGELIYQWVNHSIERYGKKEVESWYWEVWNEPDIKYWGGTFEEYCKLYDYSADAVKRALQTARIGGPETTNPGSQNAGKFLVDFLEHCSKGTNFATGATGAPLDFISFHAKGAPRFIDGMVRMNMGIQLHHVAKGFDIVANHPVYNSLPIIIGECDPEGCAACGMAVYPQNGYRNGTMYSSYTASSFVKIYDLALHYKINLAGIVSWSFEFENQPWFHGFRDLSTNGVGKPVLNVFRMFGLMGNTRIEALSDGGSNWKEVVDSGIRGEHSEIGALATLLDNGAAILLWNYHDDEKMKPEATIELKVKGLGTGKTEVIRYLVDNANNNSYETWKRIGSPQNPTPEQIETLEKAGGLQMSGKPEKMKVKDSVLSMKTMLQSHGVELIIITTK
jgi:xylan 1,4-beta-xylosidase